MNVRDERAAILRTLIGLFPYGESARWVRVTHGLTPGRASGHLRYLTNAGLLDRSAWPVRGRRQYYATFAAVATAELLDERVRERA